MGKASVVLRQILLFQILVRGFVAVDPLPPKLLNQTILMYAVDPLHSSLGLRRTSSNDPDPQLLTHAPELRDWDLSPQPLGGRSFSFVHVLPVGIERAGHAYFRIQARNTPAAAQIVSSFPIPASVSLVASSTMSIRQPPADHAPLTNHGNCRPTAPVHRSAICAPFVGNVSCASAAGSTGALPTSNGAKSHDPSQCRLPRPSARP